MQSSSAGPAGTRVGVETGWWVKVTESVDDRAAPAVAQAHLRLFMWQDITVGMAFHNTIPLEP
jgi:hypothetical protein